MNNNSYNDLINLCRHNKLKGLQSFIGQVYPINNNGGFTDWLDYHGKLIKGAGISREEVNEIIKNYQLRISAIGDNTVDSELDCLANEVNKYEKYEEYITSKLNYSFKPDTTFYPTIESMNEIQEKIFFQDRIDEAEAVLDLMKGNNFNKVNALIKKTNNQISNKGSGSIAKKDQRETQGEKKAIEAFWVKNKSRYLTDDYKFDSGPDYNSRPGYNRTKIARDIKKHGGFNSHESTIIDHAGLRKI